MNTHPTFLNEKQQEYLTEFIKREFALPESFVAHEIKSEYVHTDTIVLGTKSSEKVFATFGVSARAQYAPFTELERIELVMWSSPKLKKKEDNALVCSELCRISKYPFKNNTWFGPGHTLPLSKSMKERFGYDYYVFYGPILHCELENIGIVSFLMLIPIYEDECEWIVKNNSFDFLEAYIEKKGELHTNIDKNREHFIPSSKRA